MCKNIYSNGTLYLYCDPDSVLVDASQSGEGNLEITISARSQNIPTQVTPQGNARFSVSFVPFEACEHIINIAFNKRTVPGCPIVTRVGGDSHVTVSGQALSSAGLGRQSYLTVSNVAGSLEDLEVNVEGIPFSNFRYVIGTNFVDLFLFFFVLPLSCMLIYVRRMCTFSIQ